MSTQFSKLIVQPFIHHPQLSSSGRILIVIDGLDECDNPGTQRDLLQLISEFCLTYPSSPIVWMIASRPESYITSFFAQVNVESAYEKEEALVDSDEAREDVERFLRTELTKIQKEFSLHPQSQWPSELEFWKLANASGGLFIYAGTVIKYIGDRTIGDPTEQLRDVLQVIDANPLPNVPREEHPLALLDELYKRILSKVQPRVKENMRKFILALVVGWRRSFDQEGRNFIVLCNWLGITCDEAYAALRHLSSVFYVPPRERAHKEQLRSFHKSFIDYLSEYARSGFSHDIKQEAYHLYVQCTYRILEQAPDGIDVGDVNYDILCDKHVITSGLYPWATLARGPGTGTNVSLMWAVDEGTFANVVYGIDQREPAFSTALCLSHMATHFRTIIPWEFQALPEAVFAESCRHGLAERGLLKQIPVKTLYASEVRWLDKVQFRHSTTPAQSLSDPWNASCGHTRFGNWEEGEDLAWSTKFHMHDCSSEGCIICRRRLEGHLERWKKQISDHPISVLFTAARMSLVEFQFVDLEDGMSEWTYWFWYMFSKEERKKLGSIV